MKIYPHHLLYHIEGHSTIILPQNDQNLDLHSPLVCTCSILVAPSPFYKHSKAVNRVLL